MPASLHARTFDCTLPTKVFLRESGDVPDRVIGFTPVRDGRIILIPEGRLWYVRPTGGLSAIPLEKLVRQLGEAGAPGLDLSDHWELSNESLRHLAPLKRLRMLDVSRTRMTDEGITELRPLTGLAVLILPSGITDRAVDELCRLPHLRELTLDQAHLTDAGLSRLVSISTLEILDLSSTRVTNAGLAELARLPALRRLTLGPLITDAGAPHLAKLVSLEGIDISQTQIGDRGLEALATLPRLRSLALGSGITDRAVARLASSRSIQVLDLSRSAVTDAGVQALARLKTLEEVSLSRTAVGDACLPALAELSELRMLDLSETHITGAGLAPLAKLRHLQVLALSWGKLTRDDLQGLSHLKQVKTIVLNGIPLPESTMARLRELTPWENVEGLGTGRLQEAGTLDPLAMNVPLSLPASHLKPGGLREAPREAARSVASVPAAGGSAGAMGRTPNTRSAFGAGASGAGITPNRPVQRSTQEFALAPSQPGRIDAATRARLYPSTAPVLLQNRSYKEGHSVSGPAPSALESGRQAESSEAAGPAASRRETDNLLQVIMLQSNPDHAGAFSGLSGMRQVSRSVNLASLDTLRTENRPKADTPEDDTDPRHSLGEISVGVVGKKR